MIVQVEECIPPGATFTSRDAVPHSHGPTITNLVLIGSKSDCAKNKILPGLSRLSQSFENICLVDLAEESGVDSFPHRYLKAGPNNRLDLEFLQKHGFLNRDTLTYISTPTDSHAPYIQKMAPFTRIACEKMPAQYAADARSLRALQLDGSEIFSADHKAFNESALERFDAIRGEPAILESVRRIEGVMYETAGYAPGRVQVDCAINDTGWHLLAITLALFRAAGDSPAIFVDESLVATHKADLDRRFQVPRFATAARLRGSVRRGDGTRVQMDLRCAKGAGVNDKWVRLLDGDSQTIAYIDLNESGWAAHSRMLEELIKPEPNMRLTFEDAIALTGVAEGARDSSIDCGSYAFGKLPFFMAA
jgi:hypothetical protein